MSEQVKYRMRISLNVLEHLGVNLYSNVPAVLSEVVANSWDADATNVEIKIGQNEITITDDGHGMTLDDINDKYLYVGYKRRNQEGGATLLGRAVMGRKGIGKLSLLSIADTVQVETFKDGAQNGFIISRQDIEHHIAQNGEGTYQPTPLPESAMALETAGTRIVLTDLKKRITRSHSGYLRKRIARRFSIIGEENEFNVSIDGVPVEITDRDYFHKIQFLWYYGDESEKYKSLCNNLESSEHTEERGGTIEIDGEGDIDDFTDSITGWIGSVRKPMDLTDQNGNGRKDVSENLNKIVIMVRGKLAQENILDEFREAGFYTEYLIGEIHADFLDRDDLEDIATTSRQEIIKDDPRYEQLRAWLEKELNHIRVKWDDWRSEAVKDEVKQIPAIEQWLAELKPGERKQAGKLFHKIGQLHIGEYDDRKQLYIHTALAFEKLVYKGVLDKLETLSVENLPLFMEVVGDFDDIEASLYYQIIQERLKIISVLYEKVEDNVKEKAIQEFIFQHLWLLDPSWDRVTETPFMEENVKKAFGDLDANLSEDEKSGRVDIKYRMTSGKHVIIELKRASVKLSEIALVGQVDKYRRALMKLLDAADIKEPVEVVCIVGQPLTEWDTSQNQEESRRAMAERSIRVVTYDKLIQDSYLVYREFLEKRREAGRVSRLMERLETEVSKIE